MIKIITHPGSAHKDDFLAVCVLLATHDGAMVERREPTRAELDDPRCYVIDIGLEYDPKRHNFDHHHDHALPCAFHLVMRHLGLHDQAVQMFVWYSQLSMNDVRGPYRTAEHYGVDTSVLFALSSPIDGYILSLFARCDRLEPQSPLYLLMTDLGRDMLALLERKHQRLQRLHAEAQVVPLKEYKVMISEISQSPKLAMEIYLRQLADERIVMSITPSGRGAGWEMMRLGDNTQVDFRRLGDNPALRFVHGSGFLATTLHRLPLPEVLALAERALADAAP